MTEELRPCPFCGGRSKLEQSGKDSFTIKCKSCAVKRKQRCAKFGLDWLQEAMIAHWNKRTSSIMSKESAQELCDSIELNSEFFDGDNEEYILLREGNPQLLNAYGELFTLACADE